MGASPPNVKRLVALARRHGVRYDGVDVAPRL